MDTIRTKVKKYTCLLMALLLLGGFMGCAPEEAPPEGTPPAAGRTAAAIAEQASPVSEAVQPISRVSDTLIGFVIPQTEDIALCTLKHGFLRMAENLGYPGKLYYADTGTASVAAVERAAQEGCKGLLIWSPDNVNAAAIVRAGELRIPVVTPYYSAEGEGVSASVAADIHGYMEEVALGVAERMVERACKAGRILVYGRTPETVYAGFTEAIASYYPQFTVASFQRRALTADEAVNELAEYILWNRDIKGLFCADADGAMIVVRARNLAQSRFKAEGAPEKSSQSAANSPSPENTPDTTPGQTPTQAPGPTPVPEGLTQSIVISVAGYGFSTDTVSLLSSNDIYAFVLEPYYEAGAQSLMLLDRILSGESVPRVFRLNMPIVRMAALEKYVLINDQVCEWFNIPNQETIQ